MISRHCTRDSTPHRPGSGPEFQSLSLSRASVTRAGLGQGWDQMGEEEAAGSLPSALSPAQPLGPSFERVPPGGQCWGQGASPEEDLEVSGKRGWSPDPPQVVSPATCCDLAWLGQGQAWRPLKEHSGGCLEEGGVLKDSSVNRSWVACY